MENEKDNEKPCEKILKDIKRGTLPWASFAKQARAMTSLKLLSAEMVTQVRARLREVRERQRSG